VKSQSKIESNTRGMLHAVHCISALYNGTSGTELAEDQEGGLRGTKTPQTLANPLKLRLDFPFHSFHLLITEGPEGH